MKLKLLGNRALISKYEEEEKEGFQQAQAANDFIAKGVVEESSAEKGDNGYLPKGTVVRVSKFAGEEFEEDGKRYKIVELDEILAIEE